MFNTGSSRQQPGHTCPILVTLPRSHLLAWVLSSSSPFYRAERWAPEVSRPNQQVALSPSPGDGGRDKQAPGKHGPECEPAQAGQRDRQHKGTGRTMAGASLALAPSCPMQSAVHGSFCLFPAIGQMRTQPASAITRGGNEDVRCCHLRRLAAALTPP